MSAHGLPSEKMKLPRNPRGTDELINLSTLCTGFRAGVVGCAYAPFVDYIEALGFPDTGFNVLAMIVIGGQGTLIGLL